MVAGIHDARLYNHAGDVQYIIREPHTRMAILGFLMHFPLNVCIFYTYMHVIFVGINRHFLYALSMHYMATQDF